MGILGDIRCIVCLDEGCEFCPSIHYMEVPDVSRIVTYLPADVATHIVVGYDRFYGHFVQIYTNGQHKDDCDCPQCEYDAPAFELDHGPTWERAYDFITEHLGPEVASAVRANVVAAGDNATKMNYAS